MQRNETYVIIGNYSCQVEYQKADRQISTNQISTNQIVAYWFQSYLIQQQGRAISLLMSSAIFFNSASSSSQKFAKVRIQNTRKKPKKLELENIVVKSNASQNDIKLPIHQSGVTNE